MVVIIKNYALLGGSNGCPERPENRTVYSRNYAKNESEWFDVAQILAERRN